MTPIRIDALYVKGEELAVVEQEIDFTILPYFERTFREEINCQTANISEAILSNPFQNQNLRLGHGIHLHWALPDALTRADDQFRFPEVPDRWLVTRRKNRVVEKQWVVESNYLYPPHIDKKGVAVSIPYTSENWQYNDQLDVYKYQPGNFQYRKNDLPQSIHDNETLIGMIFRIEDQKLILKVVDETEEYLNNLRTALADHGISDKDQNEFFVFLQKAFQRSSQPYRYMGRKMPRAAWQEHFEGSEYYPSLTATGYGDPTFAAFYPNCHSVFGFHDPNPGELDAISYEIAGWYGDSKKDILAHFVGSQSESVNAAIKEKFNWNIQGDKVPDRLLCYAGISIDKSLAEQNQNEEQPAVSVTVANTPTEALSAHLADALVEDRSNVDRLRTIEDQLEAVQLAFRLDEKKLDTVARFKEMRHENGFNPTDSGILWTIRKEDVAPASQTDTTTESVQLSEKIEKSLGLINELQRKYNRRQHEITSLREQLFADWYKYMISVYPSDGRLSDYPSPDLIKHFIETKVLPTLNDKIEQNGVLESIEKDSNDNISGLKVSKDSTASSLAYQLAKMVNQLITEIEAEQETINKANGTLINYFLEQIPGPRYWQPNDPVVLVQGKDVHPTKRHGQDGILDCNIFQSTRDCVFEDGNDFSHITTEIHKVLEAQSLGTIQDKQPWNPFLLEWQTQLYPTLNDSNLHLKNGKYSSQFITDNYEAPVLNPDLELKKNKGSLTDTGNIYSGSSILTSQANPLLRRAIEKQLIDKQNILKRYMIEAGNTDEKKSLPEDYEDRVILFRNKCSAIKNWYAKKELDDPIYTLICAYEKLSDTNTLAQSLAGFNHALLMRKQTIELPIDDPLGFENYQAFTADGVAKSIKDNVLRAPSPLNAFHPIRSGSLKLLRLRLVDTFGQVKELDTDNIDTTYKMTTEGSQCLVKLPPRIIQPARLNFRWLNGRSSASEMNAHTASSPICGWLLTNKFDESLMVYDALGGALGYFKAGRWREAIDSDAAKSISDIHNPHLKRVTMFLNNALEGDQLFLSHFIGTIDDALENIQPEKNVSISSTAQLIGRPVAIVRASVGMELMGLPAINQDWNVFRQDITKNKRTSDQYTKVQIPIRLGEYGQLNDGLVGYWLEKQDHEGNIIFTTERQNEKGEIITSAEPVFYSPQSDYIDSKTIESGFEYFNDGPINFYQSLEDKPQTLTMLMDVEGIVHATAGILPNKEITIPEEQYKEALQNIEVSFLHAPLLTPKDKIHLPLRPIANHTWSWVAQEKYGFGQKKWVELFPENRLEKDVFIKHWNLETEGDSGQIFWNYLLSDSVRWLSEIDDNEDGKSDSGRAKVVNKDDRGMQSFDEPSFNGTEDLVETILEKYSTGIDPVVTEAVFSGQQEIKEGWLKLRKKKRGKEKPTTKIQKI